MTDRIWVDYNSRDEDGNVPASRRRMVHVPAIGAIVDTIDDEANRCLARVVRVGPSIVTLDPVWATFASPAESRVVPAEQPASLRISQFGLTSLRIELGAWTERWGSPTATSGGLKLTTVPTR